MRKLTNPELERLDVETFKKADKVPIIVVLDNIRSMHNIGTVFRTADAFLISKVVLCGISATPPHKDIHKTALGATESVEWEYHKETVSAIKELQKCGVSVWAVEQAEKAQMLHEFNPNPLTTYAFVFGNEVKGVAQEAVDICEGVLEIPQFGTKHSLNISVSAGIVLWDAFVKMKKTPTEIGVGYKD